MEKNGSKKMQQIITIAICIIIAVVSAIYNHMNLGEGESFKEIFNEKGRETGEFEYGKTTQD